MVDDLNIDAIVSDEFTDPLRKLGEALESIDEIAEDTFPIEAKVDNYTKTKNDLEDLADAADDIDDVHVTTTTGGGGGAASATSGGGGGGVSATPDGSGRSRFLDIDEVLDLRDQLGEDFDFERLVNRRGDITSERELVAPSLGDRIDNDAFFDALRRGDIDLDILDKDDSLTRLRQRGLLDEEAELTDILEDVNPKMGDFFKVLASLLPLIAVFVGALPAAIGGIIALAGAAVAAAGALAAVGGLGILGIGLQDGQFSMDPIRDELESVKNAFIEAFGPLAESFAPTLRELFRDIEDLFFAVASRGRVLQQFEDDIRAVGDALVRFIPPLLASMGNLGQAAAPILGQIATFLAQTDFGSLFAGLLADTLPTLRVFVDSLLTALPAIYALSKGFLLVATFITALLSGLLGFLESLGPLLTAIGVLVGGFLVMYTVIAVTKVAIGGMISVMGSLALASEVASASMVTLISVLTLGLAAAVYLISDLLSPLSEKMREVRENVENIQSRNGRQFGRGGNVYVVEGDREQRNRTIESSRYGGGGTGPAFGG